MDRPPCTLRRKRLALRLAEQLRIAEAERERSDGSIHYDHADGHRARDRPSPDFVAADHVLRSTRVKFAFES
jgi:hypothetical protein